MLENHTYPNPHQCKTRRRLTWLIACAAVAVTCAAPALALTIQPGTYKMQWRIPSSASQVSLAGRLSASMRPMNADDKKRFEGTASRNASIGLAGAAYWVVVDESKGTGKGFDSAYVIPKTAASGKVNVKSSGRVRLARSGGLLQTKTLEDVTINLVLGGAGSGVAKRAAVDLEIYTASGKPSLALLTLRGGWHGKVKTDKGEMEVQPMDVNSNSIYGEPFSLVGTKPTPKTGDAVLMGNGAGVVGDHGNVIYLGNTSSYAGKLYKVTVSKSGESVTFASHKGDTGKLSIYARTGLGKTAECRYAQVYSKAGMFVLKGGHAASLPPGDYRCHATSIDAGKKFSITVRGKSTVKVSKGGSAKMSVGGWLNAVIDPAVEAIRMKRGEQRRIHIAFTAGGDEVIGTGPGRKVWVNVRDSKGKLLSSEQAAFGPGAGCWYTLRVPGSWKTGTYRIGISFDPSPYQGTVYARKTLQVQL